MNDYILRVPRRSLWHVVFMHRFGVKMVQNKRDPLELEEWR